MRVTEQGQAKSPLRNPSLMRWLRRVIRPFILTERQEIGVFSAKDTKGTKPLSGKRTSKY